MNRVVVIAGGCGLIGKELALEVHKSGYITVVADILLTNDCVRKFPINADRLEFLEMDITNQYSIEKCIQFVTKKYNRIDALVNTSYPRGKNYGKHLEDVSYEDFCETVNMHLGGFFLVTKLFAEFFKKQGFGDIINLSSIYGVVAPKFEIYEGTDMTMPVEYAAVKSAIIHLTKYFAKYYKGYKIRFNCVSPGGILQNQPEVFISNYNKYCLNKGMLEARDIIGAIMFLLSEESKFINGHNLIIDDGFTL